MCIRDSRNTLAFQEVALLLPLRWALRPEGARCLSSPLPVPQLPLALPALLGVRVLLACCPVGAA
eukprot:10601041-Alexandrium_andersonii.AAC.1